MIIIVPYTLTIVYISSYQLQYLLKGRSDADHQRYVVIEVSDVARTT